MTTSKDDVVHFRQSLLQWWNDGGARSYPWRQNRTLYRTLIAELMLRRTRADQVVAVYEEFLQKFPDLESAAGANDETLHRILKSLGLKWRADTVIDCLRTAFARYGNDLPADREQLQQLPGIGDYVSAAVVCFADNQTVTLIDINVVRVLARLTGREYHAETRREPKMRALATACVDSERPAEYHYALLDFGALVCTARSPRCPVCPLYQSCVFGQAYSERKDDISGGV